jgi:hypothetical protein
LQNAQINSLKNFMRAKFIFPAKVWLKIEINFVLLYSTLIFIIFITI